jgi:large subunit ribosomal protein LP0
MHAPAAASAAATAQVLFGKNTTIKKVIKDFVAVNKGHPIANILPHVTGNVGFIFTNADMKEVRTVITEHRVPAPARVGAVAPKDVFVEPGPTGCDPGQTSWFQALNIPTKINRGQIEIVSRVHLIHAGTRIAESAGALLAKLNVKPFSYGLVLTQVYDNGSCFSAAVLDISEADLMAKLAFGINTVAAVSLAVGFPTLASLPHSINNAFKALLSVATETEYSFPQAEPFKEFLKNPGAFASAAPAAAAAGGGGKPAVVEKEEEPEEEVTAGGLFDED